MASGDVGVVELLLSLVGSGVVGVQAALQHPLSQGRVWITSASAFDYPAIDPGYLTNDAGKSRLSYLSFSIFFSL